MKNISVETQELLFEYTDWLCKKGYTDSDVYAEEPKAVDYFLDENKYKIEIKKYKSLAEYSKAIQASKDFPSELANILLDMTYDYAQVSDESLPILRKKMEFFVEKKDLGASKPLSDTYLKALWMKDGEGMIEERQTLYKKSLEKMMSNIKAVLRQREMEARTMM